MTPYAVRAHDLHHALSEFAPEPTTGATYQSMPLCGFERSTTIQCRGQCRRALRRFHRLRDQSPSLDHVGRNHIFPVTAVRSIAEQIEGEQESRADRADFHGVTILSPGKYFTRPKVIVNARSILHMAGYPAEFDNGYRNSTA
jgi:hypothetical protein